MTDADAISTTPLVLRQDEGAIATLTLNRPAQYNALSLELLAALQNHLEDIGRDHDLRIVILGAAGRAFSAGHDLRQMRERRAKDFYRELFGRCGEVSTLLTTMPQVTIAQVQGMATAAGAQLALACDLVVAAEHARLAMSGINVGLFCSAPAVPLSRAVAQKRAFELLMTGAFVDAATALREGLVNRVVPGDHLREAALELAHEILAKSPVAVRIGKAMFYRQRIMDLADAYRYAAEVMAENMMARETEAGVAAFVEKRDLPRYDP